MQTGNKLLEGQTSAEGRGMMRNEKEGHHLCRRPQGMAAVVEVVVNSLPKY